MGLWNNTTKKQELTINLKIIFLAKKRGEKTIKIKNYIFLESTEQKH